MQGIGGVEEQGHEPDRGKGGRDLAGHNSAFAHTGDHQLGLAICAAFQQCEGCFYLVAAQPLCSCGDRRGFLLKAAGESGQGWNP